MCNMHLESKTNVCRGVMNQDHSRDRNVHGLEFHFELDSH